MRASRGIPRMACASLSSVLYTRADSNDETIPAAPGGRYTIVLVPESGE